MKEETKYTRPRREIEAQGAVGDLGIENAVQTALPNRYPAGSAWDVEIRNALGVGQLGQRHQQLELVNIGGVHKYRDKRNVCHEKQALASPTIVLALQFHHDVGIWGIWVSLPA